MICLPHFPAKCWPMVRAMGPVDAPGVNGTTQRMGFEGSLSTGSDAAKHALAQHNDNASDVAFIGRLREVNIVLWWHKISLGEVCIRRHSARDRSETLSGHRQSAGDP
jgi:hypothetical protein